MLGLFTTVQRLMFIRVHGASAMVTVPVGRLLGGHVADVSGRTTQIPAAQSLAIDLLMLVGGVVILVVVTILYRANPPPPRDPWEP